MDLVQNQDIIIDGHVIRYVDGLYSLNDLHKASGGNPSYRPANFLKTKEVKDLIAEIESSNYDATILASKNIAVKIIRGRGKEQGTYVCKELVYRYAMWISAKFSD